MQRATTSPSRWGDERGLTVTELMVTMAVMLLIVSAALAMMVRAMGTTGIVENRRDVLGDGQVALDQMVKQIRQAESVDQAVSDVDTLDMETYINGTATSVVWRATGSAAPFALEISTDGGTNFRTVASSLKSPSVFTYTSHDGLLDQVTINLQLGTKTSEVTITSDVSMRNV